MKNTVFLAILSLLLCTVTAQALRVYFLEAGAFGTEAEAQALQQSLSSGMSPVFVEKVASDPARPWKVLVGHFPYEVEAWVFLRRLTPDTLPSGQVTSWLWDGRPVVANDLPVELPFDQDVLLSTLLPTDSCPLYYEVAVNPPAEAQAALEVESIEGLTDQELLYRGQWSPAEEAFPSLERLLEVYPDSPLVNQARIRLVQLCLKDGQLERASNLIDEVARLGNPEERSKAKLLSAYAVRYDKGKKAPETLQAFRDAASDPVLEPEHRLDAMLRTAALARLQRDVSTCWLAYLQLEKAVETPKLVAFARMHKAALAFEAVSAGKSSWEEARLLCELAEAVPDAPAEVLATARLMGAETFYKQGNYNRALEEMERLRQDFPSVARERATALYWKARCLQELGRYDEAITAFSSLEAEPVSEADLFSSLHVKARGLLEKASLLRRQGQDEAADTALTTLRERYPNSKEAKSLPSL